MKLVKNDNDKNKDKISDKEAEEAFRNFCPGWEKTLLEKVYLKLLKRVVKAFKEYFKGYKEDPKAILR